MKSFFAVVLFVLPLVVQAEVTSEAFCFSSGSGKPINFEMRTYYDSSRKFSSGFVKYQTSKKPIPLVLVNSTSETLSKSAPDQENTTWIEVFNGEATGEYEMITQGTDVASMVFTNKKKNQKIGFVLNTNVMTESGCVW
jgi:hypothetical protein